MLSDGDRRDLLERVISEAAPEGAEVEWLSSEGWSAHAQLRGASGRVGHLLTSPEWQEARFAEPRRSTFLLTASNDREDLRTALERLASVVAAYLSGEYEVEHRRGLFGTRTTLVLHTPAGIWRVGKRVSRAGSDGGSHSTEG